MFASKSIIQCKTQVRWPSAREKEVSLMEEKKEFKLFREKSLEAIESPEALNDYLRVTSPGVWLVLSSVILLLIGAVLWGIFGRINTTLGVAVSAADGQCFCIVPYEELARVMDNDTVTVDSQAYALRRDQEIRTLIVSEETNPYLRVAGKLSIGDVAVEIPIDAALADGIYAGTVITESLQPISLLLQ